MHSNIDDEVTLLRQFGAVTPDVLWMFTADWEELLFVTDRYEDIWGQSVETLAADPSGFVEAIHPDDQERVQRQMERLSNGDGVSVEFRVNPDENYGRWVWALGEPVFEDGEQTRVAGFTRDVTERKAYERELEAANDRLEDFAAMLSHDLRNPLQVAQGRLEVVDTDDRDDGGHLVTVADALDRMESMIDDVHALSQTRLTVEDPQPVDLATCARNCWTTLETGDAALVVEDHPTVAADRDALERLVQNLLENAVEHGSTSSRPTADDAVEHSSTSPDSQARQDAVEHGGSDVLVRVGETDGGFYVEDDGPGIPPDERERVFESGYSDADNRSGLGLRIVDGIADAHGWDVEILEGGAGGARFEFTGLERPRPE